MKLLVTGSSGYLGAEIAVKAEALGHEVWRLSRSSQNSCDQSNFICHDLTVPIDFDHDDFDCIIHAAGANDIASQDPKKAILSTMLTTRNVAGFALRQRMPKVVFISTFQVYGRTEGEISETSECTPLNDYAFTHLASEQWLMQMSRVSSLKWRALRLGNITGVPQNNSMNRWSLVPSCFCHDAYYRQKIIVNSSGEQKRDFLPLGLVSEVCASAAEQDFGYNKNISNVASGHSFSIKELAYWSAEIFQEMFNEECELSFGSEPAKPASDLIIARSSKFVCGRLNFNKEEITELLKDCIRETYDYLRTRDG